MNLTRLALRSARYYFSINLAVGLGVAAATAVLTGALLVGDSVRGSLRDLSLDRLGDVTHVVLADRFFDQERATQLTQEGERKAAPIILLRGSVEHAGDGDLRLAGGVSIFGVDDRFWQMNPKAKSPQFDGEKSIILNQPLAAELNVAVGDEVSIRLPSSNDVPADSPLGRKSDRVQGIPRVKVAAIIPAEGLGRFGLFPNQQSPQNAFVPLALLEDSLDQPHKANAILTAELDPDLLDVKLADALKLSLADFGFRLDQVREDFIVDGEASKTIYDYYQFSSSRMIFSRAAEQAILQAAGPDSFPLFTYLATSIEKKSADDEAIPYSTVTALDPGALSDPLLDSQGEPIRTLAEDEVLLNSWSADMLAAVVGDRIEIAYFEPESSHGVAVETTRQFKVAAITPLTEPVEPASRRRPAQFDQAPTTANDPDLTPEVEGITDQDSINDWDPPFPFDNRRIRGVDDEYWENHRTTPKAFVSLAAGEKMWGSRFGNATSIRIVADAMPKEQLIADVEAALNQRKEELGFRFLAARRNALRAASGTTPFNALFIGFSMFIIAAALMLTALLFQLGVDQRARQIGLEAAVGLRMNSIRAILLIEATLVAALGGVFGVLLGVAYAWLMLYGLRTWWVDAVVTPFLQLHFDNPATLLIGLTSGVFASLGAILGALRQLRKASPRALLAGQTAVSRDPQTNRGAWMLYGGGLLALLSIGLAILATALAGEAQAGAFFGAGAAILAALMLWQRRYLQWRSTERSAGVGFRLSQLALSNAARNPGRSTLTIGLVGAASFLIVAISSFRLAPTQRGTGGFDLIAESTQPIFHDLNSPVGRYDQGFRDSDEPLLSKTTILALRVQPGDDASCLNLYQSNSPRVLGATPQMIAHYSTADAISFEWAASAATTLQEKENPWLVLDQSADGENMPIPCVLDKNTAMYSLHLYGGVGETFETTDPDGRTTKYQVAGLLANSILQGSLIVSERNLLARFPDTSGYRMFLIQAPTGETDKVAATFEDRLTEEGFDATDAKKRLTELLAVQNTYLSTFQSLGALGLLLGTFGLATVQARNVIERRGELALLQAAGFRRNRLVLLVLLENAALLVAGLATGVAAALVAVLPHMFYGAAGVPWAALATMLAIIFAVGLIAGISTARYSLQSPLIPALRGD